MCFNHKMGPSIQFLKLILVEFGIYKDLSNGKPSARGVPRGRHRLYHVASRPRVPKAGPSEARELAEEDLERPASTDRKQRGQAGDWYGWECWQGLLLLVIRPWFHFHGLWLRSPRCLSSLPWSDTCCRECKSWNRDRRRSIRCCLRRDLHLEIRCCRTGVYLRRLHHCCSHCKHDRVGIHWWISRRLASIRSLTRLLRHLHPYSDRQQLHAQEILEKASPFRVRRRRVPEHFSLPSLQPRQLWPEQHGRILGNSTSSGLSLESSIVRVFSSWVKTSPSYRGTTRDVKTCQKIDRSDNRHPTWFNHESIPEFSQLKEVHQGAHDNTRHLCCHAIWHFCRND